MIAVDEPEARAGVPPPNGETRGPPAVSPVSPEGTLVVLAEEAAEPARARLAVAGGWSVSDGYARRGVRTRRTIHFNPHASKRRQKSLEVHVGRSGRGRSVGGGGSSRGRSVDGRGASRGRSVAGGKPSRDRGGRSVYGERVMMGEEKKGGKKHTTIHLLMRAANIDAKGLERGDQSRKGDGRAGRSGGGRLGFRLVGLDHIDAVISDGS